MPDVHSGSFVDDWDQQYDGASKHTAFHLPTLGQFLLHFDGRPVALCDVQGPDAAKAPDALDTLLTAMGLRRGGRPIGQSPVSQARAGGRRSGLPQQDFPGLRTAAALIRIFGRHAFGARVWSTLHGFAPGASAATESYAWTRYLESGFAALRV